MSRNEDIANERQLTGWALEHSQKEQARLLGELEQLKQHAEQKHREALQQQQQNRLNQLQRSSEKARTQWLQSFDRQASAMDELLHNRVRSYWEDRVEALLNERLQDIDLLAEQAQASAQDKQATLVILAEQAQALQRTLDTLH
ncbi:hypothetical protein D3C76_1189080 [compost metagenome]